MNMYSKCAPQRNAAVARPFFRSTFPSFWDEAFFGREFAGHVPAVNVAEDDKAWHIEVSAAGFRKEDFTVKLEEETLTISAEHKTDETQNNRNYSRREFRYGSFSRQFRIPKDKANAEGISAAYENGILNITVPKKEAAVKTEKEIRIS